MQIEKNQKFWFIKTTLKEMGFPHEILSIEMPNEYLFGSNCGGSSSSITANQ